MSIAIVINIQYSVKIVYWAWVTHFQPRIKAGRDVIIGIIAAAAWIIVRQFGADFFLQLPIAIAASGLLGVPVFFLGIFPLYKSLRHYIRCRNMTISLSDSGIYSNGAQFAFNLNWNEVQHIRETHDYWLIYTSTHRFLILPRLLCGEPTERVKIHSLLKDKITFWE